MNTQPAAHSRKTLVHQPGSTPEPLSQHQKRIVYGTLLAILMIGIAVSISDHNSAARDRTPRGVAENLDQMIQPRFLLENGMFGVGRFFPVHAPENTARFRPVGSDEQELMARVDHAGRTYIIGIFHCFPIPGGKTTFEELGSGDTMRHDRATANGFTPYLTILSVKYPWVDMGLLDYRRLNTHGKIVQFPYPEIHSVTREGFESVAERSLPELTAGHDVDTSSGEWFVALRPVRAVKLSCLGCHTGVDNAGNRYPACEGTTLGVMFYAVSTAQPLGKQ